MTRIAIIGPESVGKTTLACQLGQRLGMTVVEEYARKYVEQLDHRYTYQDVENIAQQQVNEYKLNPHAVFDTEMIITKVWFDVVFGKHPDWLDPWINSHKMDFYVLLKPTIPWVYDPVRENPEKREQLYQEYLDEVLSLKVPYMECDPLNPQLTDIIVDALHRDW